MRKEAKRKEAGSEGMRAKEQRGETQGGEAKARQSARDEKEEMAWEERAERPSLGKARTGKTEPKTQAWKAIPRARAEGRDR